MKVVIELSDKIYDTISYDEMPTNEQMKVIVQRIYEGTPLPKGHGRIIDISQLEYLTALNLAIHGHITWQEAIKQIKESAPTIIEADNTESEE